MDFQKKKIVGWDFSSNGVNSLTVAALYERRFHYSIAIAILIFPFRSRKSPDIFPTVRCVGSSAHE